MKRYINFTGGSENVNYFIFSNISVRNFLFESGEWSIKY